MFLVNGETNQLERISDACIHLCASLAFNFSNHTNIRSNISDVIANPNPNPMRSAKRLINPIRPKAIMPARIKALVNRLKLDTVVSEAMHSY